MVKAIEQIRRDLTTLTDKVTTIRQSLQDIYGEYLDTLGGSLEKQLVLAGFQLATQIYPENLLALSYDQREKMQQQLRRIAQDTHADLCRILTEPDATPSDEEEEAILINETIIATDSDNVEQELLEVFESIDEAIAPRSDKSEHPPTGEGDSADDSEKDKKRTELSQLAERIAASISEMMQAEEASEPIDENSPAALLEESRQLEKRIRKTLRHSSKQANRLFQEVGVLPKHIPQKVLDMALQNERPSNSNTKINNLVNLVVEVGKDGKKKQRIKITAIDLKIAEIEFGDPKVIAQRGQIRQQITKVKRLAKYYKKTKKELAIAEAEAAWRSSWHEGS